MNSRPCLHPWQSVTPVQDSLPCRWLNFAFIMHMIFFTVAQISKVFTVLLGESSIGEVK
jgi:hypothetical protein